MMEAITLSEKGKLLHLHLQMLVNYSFRKWSITLIILRVFLINALIKFRLTYTSRTHNISWIWARFEEVINDCSVALSLNARPFLPNAVGSDNNVILAPIYAGNLLNSVGGDLMMETGVVGSVLDEAPSLQIVSSENEEGGTDVIVSVAVEMARGEGIPIINNLVEVPVTMVDTHKMANCVGNPAGMEIRNQKNWLIDSSDDESYSEFYESENDLSLVRSSNVANRGKFWGKG
ncbi:hypothetical protein MA16_Dca027063 [Dendrobium catenatum]|uniref:Uncharacterized protein n=1 Tax=Dendrobium catenatum TaxID=906689 RepID=A0A2I0X9M1_9ASPA|nr:hypothetical protein MA16_Dca027063 [Dendrobium catenatum]